MTTTQQLSDDLVSGKRPIAEHIHATQSRMVNLTLLISSAAAVPAMAVSYSLFLQFDWKALTVVQAGCTGLVWITTLLRRRLSLRTRVLILLLIAFLLATSGLLTRGLIGGDWFWFLFGILLATVILGLRYGLACLVGSLIATLLIGAGVHLGHVPLAFDHNAYAESPASWLLASTGISLFLFAVLMPIGFLKKELLNTIGIVHQQALNLRTANERLQEEIHERERTEQRLRQSRERYALAEKAARVGIWDWNILTGNVQWSESVEPIFGFQPGEFAGNVEAFYECVHPEDRKHVQDAIQATLEHRVEYNTEYRIVWPDGTIRWVQAKGDVYRDEQGRPTRMVGVVLDITHRKFLEEALLESEERFRAIADYTYDWEEWIGPDGRPLWINPGGERLTGYTREECLAMPGYPLALVHESDRSLAEQYFRDALAGKTGQNLPLRICCKDGSIVHTLISWQPIYDRQGRFLGFRSSIHDVSELRRVEEDRARLREQLHQARKLEAVGQLAGGIAHDFQNLLAAIKIHTDLLDRAVAGQGAAVELLEVIREVVEQGKSMVQSLLTLSRSVPVKKAPVELMSVVEKFVALLRTMLPDPIEVVADLEPDNPAWIIADASGIHQILMNLALNARDAMPEGGTLRIGVSGVSADEVPDRPTTSASVGSWVRIVVSDTGQGIPQEIIPRLFEPFFSTKPRGEGTGLGLAVVHGIVEDHEGTIHVDSQVGHGTAFTVYLPQMESEEATAKHSSATTPSPEPSGIILLGEDNWYLGNEIASFMRYTGRHVIRAEDEVSLLEEAHQNRGKVCLLIVDSDLPESGGYEVLRNLRATGEHAPAILLTDPDETAERPVPDEYTMLLHKPFAREALIRLIDKLLRCDMSHPDQS